MALSRRFTARHRCHCDLPTSVHLLSLSSPLHHHLPHLLTIRLTTTTFTRRRWLCLCLCLISLSTSRCPLLSECTTRSTCLTQRTLPSLGPPLWGNTVLRPVVVVKPIVARFEDTDLGRVALSACLPWLVGFRARHVAVETMPHSGWLTALLHEPILCNVHKTQTKKKGY